MILYNKKVKRELKMAENRKYEQEYKVQAVKPVLEIGSAEQCAICGKTTAVLTVLHSLLEVNSCRKCVNYY